MGVDYDCQSCGACCAPGPTWGLETYIEIHPGDRLLPVTQMRMQRKGWYAGSGKAPHIHMGAMGRCPQLRGKVGKSCACGIYEERPRECSEFEPGNPKCQRLRARCGLPVDDPNAHRDALPPKARTTWWRLGVAAKGQAVRLRMWWGDWWRSMLWGAPDEGALAYLRRRGPVEWLRWRWDRWRGPDFMFAEVVEIPGLDSDDLAEAEAEAAPHEDAEAA